MTKQGYKKYTLYWKTGEREVVEGHNIDEAVTLAGYGGGAANALEAWTPGETNKYIWDKTAHRWEPRPPQMLTGFDAWWEARKNHP